MLSVIKHLRKCDHCRAVVYCPNNCQNKDHHQVCSESSTDELLITRKKFFDWWENFIQTIITNILFIEILDFDQMPSEVCYIPYEMISLFINTHLFLRNHGIKILLLLFNSRVWLENYPHNC